MKYIFLLLSSVILFSCNDCELSVNNFSIFDFPLRFNERKWNSPDIDDQNQMKIIKDYDEYLIISSNKSELRDRMICDVTENLLHYKTDYQEIVNLLGAGSLRDSFGYANVRYSDINFLSNDEYQGLNYRTQDFIKQKRLLIYTVGFNASGDCYLILFFDNLKYKGYIRAIAI